MKKVLHKFKRSLQRVGMQATKLMDPEKVSRPMSEHEAETMAICKQLIQQEDTKLLISPISGKRYIKSESYGIFVIVNNHRVQLINHTYSYTVDFESKVYDRLMRIFDTEVENRRMEMETEIRNNVKHSLTSIYQKVLKNEQV